MKFRHASVFLHAFFICIDSNIFHRFVRRPKRIVPRFYAEPRLIFCVSSDLDPIGDRNDVQYIYRMSKYPNLDPPPGPHGGGRR